MGSVDHPTSGSRIVKSVLVSLAFLIVGYAVYVFFVRTALGQQLDASSFGAVQVARTAVGEWAGRLRIILLVVTGVIFLVLLIFALIERRVRDSAVALILCLAALLISGGLKEFVITRPNLGSFGYAYNTFPSGHETVTVAALVGSYLLLPARFRRPLAILPLLILGAASGLFQVVAYAHRPSDVFAGALLVGAIAAWIPARGRGIGAPWRWGLWLFTALTGIAGALCISNWQSGNYATELQGIGTLGIALCATACVTSVLIVGAERTTAPRSIGANKSSAATLEPVS